MIRALVTGASGFIGNHLANYLKEKGYWVRGVDWNPQKYWAFPIDEFKQLDLRNEEYVYQALTGGIDEVYALAADMGGMGFISEHHIHIMQNNMRINMNTLRAAGIMNVKKYFYASSACCYPEYRQTESTNVIPLKESDAFPANPQDAYGWEKLMTELLCNYYRKQYGMHIRIARFHNIAGIYGEWMGGREKAPAAICRKVAIAKYLNHDSIDIWGDGSAVRSYCNISDCVEGIYRIMHGEDERLNGFGINLGSDEAITVQELVQMVMDIAGYHVELKSIPGPVGVAGRNSDNTLIKEILGWCPNKKIRDWIPSLYAWIFARIREEFIGLPEYKWEEKAKWIQESHLHLR